MSRAGEAAQKRQAPVSLLSGMVTFLFTDIEGSTPSWERFGDATGA
jgi:class 3 adenylate cyclase